MAKCLAFIPLPRLSSASHLTIKGRPACISPEQQITEMMLYPSSVCYEWLSEPFAFWVLYLCFNQLQILIFPSSTTTALPRQKKVPQRKTWVCCLSSCMLNSQEWIPKNDVVSCYFSASQALAFFPWTSFPRSLLHGPVVRPASS